MDPEAEIAKKRKLLEWYCEALKNAKTEETRKKFLEAIEKTKKEIRELERITVLEQKGLERWERKQRMRESAEEVTKGIGNFWKSVKSLLRKLSGGGKGGGQGASSPSHKFGLLNSLIPTIILLLFSIFLIAFWPWQPQISYFITFLILSLCLPKALSFLIKNQNYQLGLSLLLAGTFSTIYFMQFNSLILSGILFGIVIFADTIIFPESEIAKSLIYRKEYKTLPDGRTIEVKKPGIIPYLLGIFFAVAIPWMINAGYFSYIENVINILGLGIPVTGLLVALGVFIFFVYVGGISKGKFGSTTISFLGILVLLFVLSPLIGSIQSPEMIDEFSSRVGSLIGLSSSQEKTLSNYLLGIRCTFATAFMGSPPPECLYLYEHSHPKEIHYYGKKNYNIFDVKIGYRKSDRKYELPIIYASETEDINLEIPFYFFNRNPKFTTPLEFKVKEIWLERNGEKEDKKWLISPDSDICFPSNNNKLLICSVDENGHKFSASVEKSFFESYHKLEPIGDSKIVKPVFSLILHRIPCKVNISGRETSLYTLKIHIIVDVKQNLTHSANLIYLADEKYRKLVNNLETVTIPPSNGPVDVLISFEPNPLVGELEGSMVIQTSNKGNGKPVNDDYKLIINYPPSVKQINCITKNGIPITIPEDKEKVWGKRCKIVLDDNIRGLPIKTIRISGWITSNNQYGYEYEYSFSSPEVDVYLSRCS